MVFQMTDCWKQNALIDTAEAVEHAKNSREMKTNVAAVDTATGAISSGMEGVFQQANGGLL